MSARLLWLLCQFECKLVFWLPWWSRVPPTIRTLLTWGVYVVQPPSRRYVVHLRVESHKCLGFLKGFIYFWTPQFVIWSTNEITGQQNCGKVFLINLNEYPINIKRFGRIRVLMNIIMKLSQKETHKFYKSNEIIATNLHRFRVGYM